MRLWRKIFNEMKNIKKLHLNLEKLYLNLEIFEIQEYDTILRRNKMILQ